MSEPEHNPTPLDYRPPREDGPNNAVFTGQCVGAVFATMFVAPAVVLGGGIGAGWLVGDRSRDEGTALVAAFIVGGLLLMGFVAAATALVRKHRWRGFGVGMFIGLGVDLLLIGLCFGAAMR